MSETEKSSNWDSLASELGAESAPRPARPQVRPPAPPPRVKKKPADLPQSRPKGDWQELAASLGVDVPPPPPKPAPAPKPPAAPKPAAPAPAASRAVESDRESREQRPARSRGDRTERERGGRRRGQADGPPRPVRPQLGPATGEAVEYVHSEHVDAELVGAEFVDDIDLLEDLDEPSVGSEESRSVEHGETRQREDGERGGRRRRRRRRGGRRLREDAQAARSEEPRDETSDFLEVEFGEAEQTAERAIEDYLDNIEGAAPALADDEQAESAAPAERGEKRRRGRRRGRGRGRHRDAPREETSAAAERAAAEDDDLLDELAGARAPRDERADAERDDLADSELNAETDDDAELRPSHRGIPSWEEAVGVIVSANMESRAKNPQSGSQRSRGRGGRGRGRGRERR